jgi:hypothetical protein
MMVDHADILESGDARIIRCWQSLDVTPSSPGSFGARFEGSRSPGHRT